MTLLAELLSNQYAFFGGVSKDWKNAWGQQPKTTQAITPDTSVSQLQWSFTDGLVKGPNICLRVAEYCSIDVLGFASFNGCSLPMEVCFKAATRGHLEMTQWALGQNCS